MVACLARGREKSFLCRESNLSRLVGADLHHRSSCHSGRP